MQCLGVLLGQMAGGSVVTEDSEVLSFQQAVPFLQAFIYSQLLIEVCRVLFLMGLKDSGVISYGSGNVLVLSLIHI